MTTELRNIIEQLQELELNQTYIGNTDKSTGDLEIVDNQHICIQSTNEPDICSICLENVGETNKVVLPCSHILHFDCYNSFLFTGTGYTNCKKCPMCRTEIAALPPGFGRLLEEAQQEQQREQRREQQEIEWRRERQESQIERINQYVIDGDLQINGIQNVDLTNITIREELIDLGSSNRYERRQREREANMTYLNDRAYRVEQRVMEEIELVRRQVGIIGRPTYRSNNICAKLLNVIQPNTIYTREELMAMGNDLGRSEANVRSGINRLNGSKYIKCIRTQTLYGGVWCNTGGYILV